MSVLGSREAWRRVKARVGWMVVMRSSFGEVWVVVAGGMVLAEALILVSPGWEMRKTMRRS